MSLFSRNGGSLIFSDLHGPTAGLGERRLWIRILPFFFCWILICQFKFQFQRSHARVAVGLFSAVSGYYLMLLHGLSTSWVHWIGFGIFDEKIKCFLQFVTWARDFTAKASLKINLKSLSQMLICCLMKCLLFLQQLSWWISRPTPEVWVLNCIQYPVGTRFEKPFFLVN